MIRTLLVSLSLVACLTACKSGDHHDSVSDVPCICGTPEAAIDGCASACCVSGEGNPENSDCVCSAVEIDE